MSSAPRRLLAPAPAVHHRNLPVTVFAVAKALSHNPEAVAAMREANWEIASHGLRWLDYRNIPAETERAHIARSGASAERTHRRPSLGFYQAAPASRRWT